METRGIYTQYEEKMEWINSLSFYKDEIRIMRNRLGKIASKNSSTDILGAVDHFRNQLIIQKEQIDTIIQDINRRNAEMNATGMNQKAMLDPTTRNSIISFQIMFTCLTKKCNTFLIKWM
jgi:hypothetical protein